MIPLDPTKAELFVEAGPEQGKSYPLSLLATRPMGLLLGRFSSCDIRFPADARMIGREHARIVARPEGIVLLGLHQNGTFVDGTVVGQGGEIALRLGARIQLGEDGPILLVREQQKSAIASAAAPPRQGTLYEVPARETDVDLRAEIDALKAANREMDRQNAELRSDKELLLRQLHSAPPAPPEPASLPPNDEMMALLKRFSRGLLELQKMLRDGQADSSSLQNKLELIICDLDELHSAAQTAQSRP